MLNLEAGGIWQSIDDWTKFGQIMEDQTWDWSCSQHHDRIKTRIDYVYFYAKGVFIREADPKDFINSNIERNQESYDAMVSFAEYNWKNSGYV